jgi:carboxyl-terminal processing protease
MDIIARMKIIRSTWPVFLCCVAFLTVPHGELFAQSSSPESVLSQVSYYGSVPSDVLEEGNALEESRQWAEALTFYQQALREYPDDANLKQRQAMARIHYDLHRRYADTSFLKTVQETSGTKSLNVYAEVLLKIQSYYVDQPNWSQIAGYGLTSLEVAMYCPEFRETNLPGVSDTTITNSIRETRETLKKYPAGNRNDTYVIASTAASLLESKLGLPVQATMYEFTCGAISALDTYSAFMSGNQYDETMSQIEGNFVGLGVELQTLSDSLKIVGVIPNGSAGIGGIRKGDEIIQVDQLRVAEIGSERAADLLRGVEGSFVDLIIKRDGTPMKTSLERKRVEIPSVSDVSIVDKAAGVGYINLTNFQKTTARDFDEALWDLHRQGMRSLIVDVRGNPGGLLSASVEVADRFISSGIIVSTHGRNPMEDYVHHAQMANTWRVPLVVLIDQDSASASEIFAAAIRDHKRGTIVGRRSYGKGSVQGIFPLNVSGGGVRLTTAKFYSPSGQPISSVGVNADITVRQAAKPATDKPFVTDDELRVGIQAAIQAAEKRQQAQQQASASQS